MAPTTTDIAVFAVWLFWTYLHLTPAAMKNGVYDVVLSTEEVVKQMLLSLEMSFAPGLLDVLQSKTPPTISYFKSLPLYLDKRWGVYLLVLEKAGKRPRIYIGSGTHSRGGLKCRIENYVQGYLIPKFVQRALDEGYKITHKGLLCWSKMPATASERYWARAIFLLAECVFSLYLWAMVSRTTDYGMPHLCPWDLATMEYDGCCSHICLYEKVQDSNEILTPEQIDAIDSARKLMNSRRDDITRGPVRKSISAKKTRVKALETKRFSCDICNLVCADSHELKNHLATKKHELKASGIPKAVRLATKRKELHAENLASRKFHCSSCDYTTTTKQNLDGHNTSKRHLKKVKLQSGS